MKFVYFILFFLHASIFCSQISPRFIFSPARIRARMHDCSVWKDDPSFLAAVALKNEQAEQNKIIAWTASPQRTTRELHDWIKHQKKLHAYPELKQASELKSPKAVKSPKTTLVSDLEDECPD